MSDDLEIKIVPLQTSDGSDAGYAVRIGGRAYSPEEALAEGNRILSAVQTEDRRRVLAGTDRPPRHEEDR